MVGLNPVEVNRHAASRVSGRAFCLIRAGYVRLRASPFPLPVVDARLNAYLTLGAIVALLVLVAAAGWLLLRRRPGRRTRHLTGLLDLADRLEHDLKTCRSGLQQAYAVMSINPDLPAAGEQDARHAIDAGLRALLQQRLWIRDRLPYASQQELEAARDSLLSARARLRPLLQALTQAQHDLDSAMRQHIQRDSDL